MTLKPYFILGLLAAVPAVPATALLIDPESPVRATADWIGDAYHQWAGVLHLPVADGPEQEESRRIAAAKSDDRLEPSSAPARSQPWDDPDWDKKVAEKLLEKLIEIPGDPSGTGAIETPTGDGARRVAEDGGATSRDDFRMAALPEPPPPGIALSPPTEQAARPESGAKESTAPPPPRVDAAPAGYEPTDDPSSVPPAPDLARDAPESASPREKDVAREVAGLPSTVPEEVASEAKDRFRAMSVPIPPPRPASASLPRDETPRVATRSAGRQEEDARAFAHLYLQSWSAENPETLESLQKMSGGRVEYFGRPISKRAWIQKKRSFVDTWPVRLYRHRPGTMDVRCKQSTGKCVVKSTVDWETISPTRGDFAAGVSQLELGIDFSGPQPRIYRESNLRVHARRNLPHPDDRPEQFEAPQHEFPPQAFIE